MSQVLSYASTSLSLLMSLAMHMQGKQIMDKIRATTPKQAPTTMRKIDIRTAQINITSIFTEHTNKAVITKNTNQPVEESYRTMGPVSDPSKQL